MKSKKVEAVSTSRATTMRGIIIPRNRPCFWKEENETQTLTSSGGSGDGDDDDDGDSGFESSGIASSILNGVGLKTSDDASTRLQPPTFLSGEQIRNLPRRRPLFTFDPAAPRDGRDLYLFGGDYGTFDGKTAAKFFVPAASCLDELTYPAAAGTSIPFREVGNIVKLVPIAVLGRGGFGTVLRAVVVNNLRTVALKKIPFFPPTEVNRPETELSLLSLTDKCPFFPRFHGGFPFGGHLYLAMEECAMGTLGAYDAAPVPISWADRQVLFSQLAVALHYLHTIGIVHRDIKPDNMGLSGDGQLRLLDLGLAVRLLRERGQRFPVWDCADYKRHAPRLRGARKIGTPGFMAPEVLAGKMYSYEVDWYSFGVTLWAVAMRRLPPKRGLDAEDFVYDPYLSFIEKDAVHQLTNPRKYRPRSIKAVSELAYFRGVDFAAVRSGAVRTSLAHYFVNPEMEAIENGCRFPLGDDDANPVYADTSCIAGIDTDPRDFFTKQWFHTDH